MGLWASPGRRAPSMCSRSAPQDVSFVFDIAALCLSFHGEERAGLPVFIVLHCNGNNEIIQYFNYQKGFRPIFTFILDFLICESSRGKVKKKIN